MFSDNATTVLKRRYLKKNEKGEAVENPEDMISRVASAIAEAEALYGKSKREVNKTQKNFFNMMMTREFIPNSPTLMNAGRELGQLSACFVLPIEDSMEGIFETVKNTALIHKTGGGTGFSFSRLRPASDSVKSTQGVSSGPISFMEVFNAATETIKQGGTRRGANMGILRVDHPDIINFIVCKKDNDKLNNFNISVALTEQFMEAVEMDEDYELINPRDGKAVSRLNAKKVFQMIVNLAWRNGEPGIIFIDRINSDNPTPEIALIESTNPCGEQPLMPFESCNLGSINLSKFVTIEGDKAAFDFNRLKETVNLAVRFLDNVIDINKYPLELIEETTKGNRKIGLGVMGFADTLIQLGIAYNSDKGVKTGKQIMKFIKVESVKASIKLAKERGCFPNYEKSIFADSDTKIRNATLTTIAPTGTISIIADSSSGIEPLFAICYYRNVMDNDKLVEINSTFLQIAKERGFYSKELMEKIAKEGTIQHIEEIPEDVKKVFVTSHDISPEWHIKMQAAFQKYVDNAVSKTVNFSNSATTEDIGKAYLLAYRLGCKGVTVYRDGSRDAQVLNIGEEKKKKQELTPRARPRMTSGLTLKNKIGCGNLYVTVNADENGICEVFTNTGRAGGCPSQSEATSRLISLALRSNIDLYEITEQLKGIRCLSCIRTDNRKLNGGKKILSCPDAIAWGIEQCMTNNFNEENGNINGNKKHSLGNNEIKNLKEGITISEQNSSEVNIVPCPDCGSSLEMESGCVVCRSCGYSKCN